MPVIATVPRDPRWRLVAVIVTLLIVCSAISLARPAPTVAWDAGSFSSSSESQLLALTRRVRASAGLATLKVDARLTSVARWRSKDMITRDYFSHTIPGYGKVWDKLQSIGYCYKVAGENIGWNDSRDDVATAAMQDIFMGSAGHRANILGKAWDVVGIGAYKGPTGKKIWTVLFADKCGSTASKPRSKPQPKSTDRPRAVVRSLVRATPGSTTKPKPSPTIETIPSPLRREASAAGGLLFGMGSGPGGDDGHGFPGTLVDRRSTDVDALRSERWDERSTGPAQSSLALGTTLLAILLLLTAWVVLLRRSTERRHGSRNAS